MAVFIGSNIYRQASFGRNHPLSQPSLSYGRQGAVLDMCRILGWINESNFITSPRANIATLGRYHDVEYVQALQSADMAAKVPVTVRRRYNFGTMENPLFKGVFARAATTVGGSIEAAKQALSGKIAFHPSGGTHHGMKDRAHGFCYFNDPVFCILTFLDASLERVLYLDIDAHHGDGVERAFLNDPRVSTVSIHEENRWPYTGKIQDQGPGRLNIPVPQGLDDSEFSYIFEHLVLPYCESYAPQAIIITCGTDALAADPLSKMNLSNRALWQAVLQMKARTEHLVVLGGGGYNPWTTVRAWVGLWGLITGNTLPEPLPENAQAILAKFDSDLIDEEDINPGWFTRLADDIAAETGIPVRAHIKALVKTLAAQHGLL